MTANLRSLLLQILYRDSNGFPIQPGHKTTPNGPTKHLRGRRRWAVFSTTAGGKASGPAEGQDWRPRERNSRTPAVSWWRQPPAGGRGNHNGRWCAYTPRKAGGERLPGAELLPRNYAVAKQLASFSRFPVLTCTQG